MKTAQPAPMKPAAMPKAPAKAPDAMPSPAPKPSGAPTATQPAGAQFKAPSAPSATPGMPSTTRRLDKTP